jgi:hypothetical protein
MLMVTAAARSFAEGFLSTSVLAAASMYSKIALSTFAAVAVVTPVAHAVLKTSLLTALY